MPDSARRLLGLFEEVEIVIGIEARMHAARATIERPVESDTHMQTFECSMRPWNASESNLHQSCFNPAFCLLGSNEKLESARDFGLASLKILTRIFDFQNEAIS